MSFPLESASIPTIVESSQIYEQKILEEASSGLKSLFFNKHDAERLLNNDAFLFVLQNALIKAVKSSDNDKLSIGGRKKSIMLQAFIRKMPDGTDFGMVLRSLGLITGNTLVNSELLKGKSDLDKYKALYAIGTSLGLEQKEALAVI